MKQFLKNIIGFLFVGLVPLILITLIFIFSTGPENLPALNFTSSYSFNEKVLFLKNHKSNPTTTKKYLNTASWGMNMQESFQFLKFLSSIYDLEDIIIVSNIVDFQLSNKRINFDFIHHYLAGNKKRTFIYFLKNLNLKYYVSMRKRAKEYRHSRKNYTYLGYDQSGMAALEKTGFNISKRRWSQKHIHEIHEAQYAYLDSISTYCENNNLKLHFFQSPFREGLLSQFSPKEMDILNSHIERTETILLKNHHFVNSNVQKWNDSLFVDGIHFNSIGAEVFTNYCIDQKNGTNTQQSVK